MEIHAHVSRNCEGTLRISLFFSRRLKRRMWHDMLSQVRGAWVFSWLAFFSVWSEELQEAIQHYGSVSLMSSFFGSDTHFLEVTRED